MLRLEDKFTKRQKVSLTRTYLIQQLRRKQRQAAVFTNNSLNDFFNLPEAEGYAVIRKRVNGQVIYNLFKYGRGRRK